MSKLKSYWVFLALLIFSSVANATVYYVKPSGAGSACTSTAPCANLTAALAAAAVGDEIRVAVGTYTVPACQQDMTKAVTIKGGYSTDFNSRSSDASQTVFTTGGAAGYCRVFSIHTGHSEWLTFDTVKITGVTNNDSQSGALETYDTGAWLRLNNVLITGNNMKSGNGGIALTVSGDKLEITNSEISSNTSYAQGGGIYIGSGITASITNTKFKGNKATSSAQTTNNGGAIYATNAVLTIDGCSFESNTAFNTGNVGLGGAIYADNTTLTITKSSFELNESGSSGGTAPSQGGGAIFTTGKGAIRIDQSLFANNKAVGFGGGLMIASSADNSIFELTNSTFYENRGSRGAAIEIGGTVKSNLSYLTIINNTSTNYEGAGLTIAVQAPTTLTASFIAGNVAGYYSEIRDMNNPRFLKDGGFNIIGLNGTTSIEGGGSTNFNLMFDSGTSMITPSGVMLDDLLVHDEAATPKPMLADNGGIVKTLRIVKDDVNGLWNRIPNDNVMFYGMGKSAQYPFTSLKQAHGAMKAFEDYEEGIFYFDLGGSYDVNNDYLFTPGAAGLQFSTHVEKDGWVLIASGKGSTDETSYPEVNDLVRRSDTILTQSVVMAMNPDEVRISSPRSVYGDFDMRTKDATIISEIKSYKVLSNNADLGRKVWYGTHVTNMSSATNSDLLNDAYPTANAKKLSHNIIGHLGDSANGFHWQVHRAGFEIISYAGNGAVAPKSDLNLWVRASGVCDSSMTDARGLKRPDFVNPNDPNQYGEVHDCDVGAFEFNDGYKVDCYSEDGMRPQFDINYANNGQVAQVDFGVCYGGDLWSSSPKAIIDNIGSVNSIYLVILGLIGFGLDVKRRRYH